MPHFFPRLGGFMWHDSHACTFKGGWGFVCFFLCFVCVFFFFARVLCVFFFFFDRKPKVYPPSRAAARPQARPAGAGGGVWGGPPQRRGAASVEKCPTSPLGQVPLRSHATFLPPLGRVFLPPLGRVVFCVLCFVCVFFFF